MTDELKKGKVVSVNAARGLLTIEYVSNGKKTVVGRTGDTLHSKLQTFRPGDEVSFRTRLTDRGDKLAAYDLKFLYNNALHLMIQKARIENRFSGYLKEVEGKFFVKEISNYLFFPLHLSRWEKVPSLKVVNEAVAFKLINLDNPARLSAELFSHAYIASYYEAQKLVVSGQAVEAVVERITPHAVYVQLFDGNITAKLGGDELSELQPGDKVQVKISYLSPDKISVEKINEVKKD
jgi:ribosomal protein L19